ncbi:Transposase (putative), gypsy type [Corchorus capsularis]|uniref:Transposase (Putative), gypsy type n=1 Tax=Corchorus capsularis TaxID=210143 RepID=A0A1R3KCG8_COCAP|nr:Transposase (putative), gypsy type [Corchorus capsularis]
MPGKSLASSLLTFDSATCFCTSANPGERIGEEDEFPFIRQPCFSCNRTVTRFHDLLLLTTIDEELLCVVEIEMHLKKPDLATSAPNIVSLRVTFSTSLPQKAIRRFVTSQSSKRWAIHSTAQIENSAVSNEDRQTWEACRQALSAFRFSMDEQDKILGKAFGHVHSPYWGEERKKEVPKYEIVNEILDYLRSLSLSDDDIYKLLKKFPEVLGCSIEHELRTNVQILEKEWGIKGIENATSSIPIPGSGPRISDLLSVDAESSVKESNLVTWSTVNQRILRSLSSFDLLFLITRSLTFVHHGELSDDSDIELFESLRLPLRRIPPPIEDSQNISGTPSMGNSSIPRDDHQSDKGSSSSEIPLVRKRKITEPGEASSALRIDRPETNDPTFSSLSPLPPPRSSYSVSVGELGPVAPPIGSVADFSSSATEVAYSAAPNVAESSRADFGSLATSSGSVVSKYVVSKYVRGADNASIRAVRAHVSRVGLGPITGFKFCYPTEDDRLYNIRQNRRRAFFTRVMFECGFRLPGHPFVHEVLRYYDIVASQVTPNAWILIMCYVVNCIYRGWKPSLKFFRHEFRVSNNGGFISFNRRKRKTFFETPSSWRDWKVEFFGIQIRKGMKWPIRTRWTNIQSKSYNVAKYELNSKNQEQLRYFSSQTLQWKEILHAARLILCGISPLPYQMSDVDDSELEVGVCQPLVFKRKELVDGEEIEIVDSTVIVNALCEDGDEFMPEDIEFESGRTSLPDLRKKNEGRPGLPVPVLMSEIESSYGNLNKDLEEMSSLSLAERRARQNARRAGISPSAPSPVPTTTVAEVAKTATVGASSLQLATVRPLASHPTSKSPPLIGSNSRPSFNPEFPSFLSGIFSGGGFVEWYRKDCERETAPRFIDLMVAFFSFGLNYADINDFRAVRDAAPVERAALMVGASIQVFLRPLFVYPLIPTSFYMYFVPPFIFVQNLVLARGNFAAFEKEISEWAPQVAKYIFDRLPGAPLVRHQKEQDQSKTLILEKDARLKAFSEDLSRSVKALKDVKLELQDEKDRVQRRNKTIMDEREVFLKEKASWAKEKTALQVENNRLIAQVELCLEQTAAHMNSTRDSAIYLIQREHPNLDVSGVNFESDELPPGYLLDPIIHKTLEAFIQDQKIDLY